ncbi:MAG: hypothetical protein EXQ74_00165 [Thermoleophilia bacterium]|nr:hypothetical protein [Thermoleophilia bacterium]
MSPLTRDELRSRRAVRRQADRYRSSRVLTTVVGPAVLVVVVIVAVVLAFRGAPEGAAPAASVASPVPPSSVVGAPAPQRVVIGRAGQVEVVLPVAEQHVTAIYFHPVAEPGAINMVPATGLAFEVASDTGGGQGTAGVDVGALAGTPVYSPVDGVITAVVPHRVFGRSEGLEIIITPSGVPDAAVRVTRVEPAPDGLVPRIGSAVGAGRTIIGRVRDLSGVAEFDIAQFTNDAGNNVQVEVLRQTTGPGT